MDKKFDDRSSYKPRQSRWQIQVPYTHSRPQGIFSRAYSNVCALANTFLSSRQNRLRVRRLIAIIVIAVLAIYLEIFHHASSIRPTRPTTNLDPPFVEKCVEPLQIAKESERANAAIVMMATNKDVNIAKTAIRSFESRFNQYFQYPIIFINDQPFSDEFKSAMKAEISGNSQFEIIPSGLWGYPDKMKETEREQARKKMRYMEEVLGQPHAAREGYHHMCRYQSGQFYDHPALQQYDWYWRIEPDVEYTCTIPYDPFLKMIENNKTYGWTIALYELPLTSPTMAYHVSKYKELRRIPSTSLWNSMIEPSTAPWPIRNWLYPWLKEKYISKTNHGDDWKRCHYWSNFEIANLNFYRSQEYRDFFRYMDEAGGFYFERWGDATFHSLALALFAKPEDIHWFQDFGYRHNDFQQCPAGTEFDCQCDCDPEKFQASKICLPPLRISVVPPGEPIPI